MINYLKNPLFLTWMLTNKCNLRCKFCYLEDYQGKELELDEINQVQMCIRDRWTTDAYDLFDFSLCISRPINDHPKSIDQGLVTPKRIYLGKFIYGNWDDFFIFDNDVYAYFHCRNCLYFR